MEEAEGEGVQGAQDSSEHVATDALSSALTQDKDGDEEEANDIEVDTSSGVGPGEEANVAEEDKSVHDTQLTGNSKLLSSICSSVPTLQWFLGAPPPST